MSNLESVRGLYEAFAKSDVPTVLAFLDANIAWTEAEGFPYGGTYNGPNAVLEGVFMRLGSEWDGLLQYPMNSLMPAIPSLRWGSTAALTKLPARASRQTSRRFGRFETGRPFGLFSMSTHYWFTELYRQPRNLCNRGEPNETLPPM
jgi:uncharacterized protein